MNSIYNLKSTEFNKEEFCSPSAEFQPVYGWFWNGPVTDEKTEEQLLEMKRLGINGFCIVCEPRDFRPWGIPTLTDPNYLTIPYFERYKYAVKRASELGMKCWLYDEGGWPSGSACGLVMIEHPECARRTLDKRTVTLKKGESYRKTDEDSFAAFINGSTMIEEGFLADGDVQIDEYYARRVAFEAPATPEVPDLTLRDSTDYFIEITHEQYKKFISEYFGNTVTAVFTDEPKAPPIPFRASLVEEYEQKYGESVLPHLPAIFGAKKAEGDSITAKIRWFDLSSRAFCDTFLLNCKEWSNKNGLMFTGHLDRDDEPRGSVLGKNFHIMRGLRCMDIPGIDAIWRQIFPNINGKKYENRFYPRYASSAAAQNGTHLALTESFGVYGNGLTFEQMRFVVGFQAIRGVTLINPLKISYERRGMWLAGELPSFEEGYACYAHLSHFNKYLERLSYVMTRGERVTRTALYYPINNFWAEVDDERAADEFDALGFELEGNGIDFDIVDDDVIFASETTSTGVISMGRARYNEIIIPSSSIITDTVKEKLRAFEAGGGRILYSAKDATKTVDLLSREGEIIVSKRTTDDGVFICLFNQSTEEREIQIKEDSKNAYLINITDGKIFPCQNHNGTLTVHLESGESAAIYATEKIIETDPIPSFANEVTLEGFRLRRVKSFVLGDIYTENHEIEEPPVDIALGKWENAVGKEFSGTCAYSTEFSGISSNALLDLGDVRHTCEVFINGISLGVKIMKPYRFDIPKELLKDKNILEIFVTNTVGNQQIYTKTFDKWASWQLSAYNEKQQTFDRDTLDSGLYGPIKVFF